jgi:tetratricopeptide (TPR) repeat protein
MTKDKHPVSEGKDEKGNPKQLEIEEVTKIVLDVISRWQSTRAKPVAKFSRVLNWMSTHWVIVLFCISVLSVLGAWILYDVSPLHPLKRIAYEQQEYKHNEEQRELTKKMVGHQLALGKSFLDIGQYEAAKREYQEALKIDPANNEAQMGLYKAGVYGPIQEQYSPEVVEQRINLILEVNPEDPHAYAFLGDLYITINEDTAIENYEKAKSLDPNVAMAYFGLGFLYGRRGRGRLDEAIEMLETASKLSKLNQKYLNNLGSLYAKNKQYSQAIEIYERVLKLDEAYLLTFCEIAKVHQLMVNFEEALVYQQQLVRDLDNPEISNLPKNKDVWRFEIGNEEMYLFDQLEKKYYAYYNLSVTLFLLGREEEAYKFMKEADGLQIYDSELIKVLVDFDLERLRNEKPALSGQIDAYRKKLFSD